MNTVVFTYLFYVVISVGLTIWVAQTLHKNGQIFLEDAFHGNLEMAKSVNHLLVVGFYLINLGFILLFLKLGVRPQNAVEGVEYLATKLGVVLLTLGVMHFFNMFNFNKMRIKGNERHPRPKCPTEPPVIPAN
ncbi:MAG: hypothetical protein WCO60_17800 [Verrucomicrobiota bacterium]